MMVIHFLGHIECDMVTRNAGMFYMPLDLWDSKTQSYRFYYAKIPALQKKNLYNLTFRPSTTKIFL